MTDLGWSTNTDWTNAQATTNIDINSGTFELADAIPASAVAQYDATKLSVTDTEVVNTWSDGINTYDATGGDPIYYTNQQNGNPVVEWDGTDDYLNTSLETLTQPVTIIAVVPSIANDGTTQRVVGRAPNSSVYYFWQTADGGWAIYAGSSVAGGTTSTPAVLTAVFDGSSSVIRENGVETNTGDVGNNNIDSVELGADAGGNRVLDGQIAEVIIYDADLDAQGDLNAEEGRLADKWGISLS